MPARPWRVVVLGGILLGAVLAVGTLDNSPASLAIRPATPLPLATPHPGDVALGRQVHLQNCASCHGANAEGAANWLQPDARGNLPPPPHDDTGHTWRHSDAELAEIIRNGMRDIFNTTPELTMPPFQDRLSDEEIAAVIAYFKSLWSHEHRRFQEEQNRRHPLSRSAPASHRPASDASAEDGGDDGNPVTGRITGSNRRPMTLDEERRSLDRPTISPDPARCPTRS